MADEFTADEIRTLLNLEPKATCGFVRITYLSPRSIASGGLPPPFADGRPIGSALYFMVTPTAPVRLHRSITTISAIRSRSFCCAATAPASASSSVQTCVPASTSSSLSQVTRSILRG